MDRHPHQAAAEEALIPYEVQFRERNGPNFKQDAAYQSALHLVLNGHPADAAVRTVFTNLART